MLSVQKSEMSTSKRYIQDELSGKNPFAQYGQLRAAGGSVIWGNPTDPATYPEGAFDVVYDNNGKNLEACRPLIDHYKAVLFGGGGERGMAYREWCRTMSS